MHPSTNNGFAVFEKRSMSFEWRHKGSFTTSSRALEFQRDSGKGKLATSE